jgi:hypothetical protein
MMPPVLSDGHYDTLVIDADTGSDGVLLIDLTIVSGPHKGDVVQVRGVGIDRDPLDLLAAPGTLTVTDGEPHLHLEG